MSIIILPSTLSTNDEVRLQVAQGADLPIVVAAASQSAGRGRMGRQWSSPQGGLYLSIGVELAAAVDKLAALPLVVALALQESLADCVLACRHEHNVKKSSGLFKEREPESATSRSMTDSVSNIYIDYSNEGLIWVSADDSGCHPERTHAIKIKWPNDIVVGDKKLAGILVEALPSDTFAAPTAPTASAASATSATSATSAASRFVIGIGINVNRPASDAFARAIYLSDIADRQQAATAAGTLQSIAEVVSDSVLSTVAAWQRSGFDFALLTSKYNSLLAILGEQVTVRDALGNAIASGTVGGVDGGGHLLLAKNGSIQAVAAGEVTLRPKMTGQE